LYHDAGNIPDDSGQMIQVIKDNAATGIFPAEASTKQIPFIYLQFLM
jgi:hypothetical protein